MSAEIRRGERKAFSVTEWFKIFEIIGLSADQAARELKSFLVLFTNELASPLKALEGLGPDSRNYVASKLKQLTSMAAQWRQNPRESRAAADTRRQVLQWCRQTNLALQLGFEYPTVEQQYWGMVEAVPELEEAMLALADLIKNEAEFARYPSDIVSKNNQLKAELNQLAVAWNHPTGNKNVLRVDLEQWIGAVSEYYKLVKKLQMELRAKEEPPGRLDSLVTLADFNDSPKNQT